MQTRIEEGVKGSLYNCEKHPSLRPHSFDIKLVQQLPSASPEQVSPSGLLKAHLAPRPFSLFLLCCSTFMPGLTTFRGLPIILGEPVAKHIRCSSRTAAGHRPPGINQQACAWRSDVQHRGKHLALRASNSSFGLDVGDIREDADSTLQDVQKVCKDVQ